MIRINGGIFNIQRFSVNDGPGIRTTVFTKGCNLRCLWCHNPESYISHKQLMVFPDLCAHCGKCERVCPQGVTVRRRHEMRGREFSWFPGKTETACLAGQCIECGKCVESCLFGAIRFAGEWKSAEEIMEVVRKDKIYYENSGGGVTVSGGEPLLQADFTASVFRLAKEEGIHTALDTAGNVEYKEFEKVMPYVDMVLLDLKCMDSKKHKAYTGVPNERILENAKKLLDTGIEMEIRMPAVAGVNDDLENMERLLAYIDGYDNVKAIKILPYHDMGIQKGYASGSQVHIFQAPDQERIHKLEEMVHKQRR